VPHDLIGKPPDVLNVTGLFILNRFRNITREVIAMLNFDLMDTVAGRQIYNEGMPDMLTDALRERFGIAPDGIV
jgi:hypothetical protein